MGKRIIQQARGKGSHTYKVRRKAFVYRMKYPRKIEIVKELPKTVSGKIKRVELRNREWL